MSATGKGGTTNPIPPVCQVPCCASASICFSPPVLSFCSHVHNILFVMKHIMQSSFYQYWMSNKHQCFYLLYIHWIRSWLVLWDPVVVTNYNICIRFDLDWDFYKWRQRWWMTTTKWYTYILGSFEIADTLFGCCYYYVEQVWVAHLFSQVRGWLQYWYLDKWICWVGWAKLPIRVYV